MPVKVSCPSCSKELNAQDELIGHSVACPGCGHKFQIRGVAGNVAAGVAASPTAAPVPPSQPAANPLPAASPAQRARELPPPPPTGGADSSTANLERISLGGPVAKPRSTAGPASSGTPAQPHPPVPPPQAPNQTPLAPAKTPAAATPPAARQVATFKASPPERPQTKTPATNRREVKKAKFVESGAIATRINLGEDGQLPNLVVADGKSTAEVKDEANSSSPVLMIVVLIFSVGVSVVMLVAPEGAGESQSTTRQESIEHLEANYIGTGPELEPYQVLLREGLQAERRGDQQEARLAFRRVLRMLRAESIAEEGLTAPRWANVEAPPNDQDLEKHLNVLLADN